MRLAGRGRTLRVTAGRSILRPDDCRDYEELFERVNERVMQRGFVRLVSASGATRRALAAFTRKTPHWYVSRLAPGVFKIMDCWGHC